MVTNIDYVYVWDLQNLICNKSYHGMNKLLKTQIYVENFVNL